MAFKDPARVSAQIWHMQESALLHYVRLEGIYPWRVPGLSAMLLLALLDRDTDGGLGGD